MKRLRNVVMVVVCLGLGAIASIGSAWVCQLGHWGGSVQPRQRNFDAIDDDDRRRLPPMPGGLLAPRAHWALGVPGRSHSQVDSSAFGLRTTIHVFDSMSAARRPAWVAETSEAGWPFRCCGTAAYYVDDFGRRKDKNLDDEPSLLIEGIPSTAIGLRWLQSDRAAAKEFVGVWRDPKTHTVSLAVVPIWPGFLFNTLLYSGMAFGVTTAFAAWRRSRRLGAGQCTACGYQMGTLPVCPECGVSAKARPGSTTAPAGASGS